MNSIPEELWIEVCSILQDAADKTIPKKRKSKTAKRLFEEALQTAEEQREGKNERGKGTSS